MVSSSMWLIEHLLRAEHTDRAMRSVSRQMTAVKFPVHRDLAGFDWSDLVSESRRIGEPLASKIAFDALSYLLDCHAGAPQELIR